MKKVLILSDLTLENIIKTIERNEYHFTVSFNEDIVSELHKLIEGDESFDCIYVHADNYFKYYDFFYIEQLLKAIAEVSKKAAYVLVSNLLLLNKTYSQMLNYQSSVFNDNSNKLIAATQTNKNVIYIDHISGIMKYGLTESYNFNLGFLYQMPYKRKFIEFAKESLLNHLDHLYKEEKKVVIIDCDNTLWNGIIGEDGIENIACDNSAKGVIYFQFQKFLRSLIADGFLLCLCSKNNLEEVHEAFLKKRFPLKWSDFIATKINWENKFVNIKEIAEELNLSTRSFIFVDDSAFELNSVKELLPEVVTFQFSNDVEIFHSIINSFYFKRKVITEADADKTRQYAVEQKRKELQKNTDSFEDYVKKLDIRVAIKVNNEENLERLSQMTGKTNQFNFNKIPYSVADLQNIVKNNGTIYSCAVSDIMGDYGIVGMAILLTRKDGNSNVKLHNMLLSCRALGRGVEDIFWNEIKKDVEAKNRVISEIEFIKTERNEVAEGFLSKIKSNDSR